MTTIYKYQVNGWPINLPVGAVILKAGVQGQQMYVWALVDTEQPEEKRNFRIVGTGHRIDFDVKQARHIDTVQQDNGLVWHVFETN